MLNGYPPEYATGEYIPTETLCEQFVDEYNQWLKNIQFIKAHPETFK